ncbi:NERD domain-containing protein [Actinomadura madurae]|uniref:nuclease-related domain-containing protein n=1 Tax=Actinomadura madurae TaxID=1993 RepID=UPI002025BFEA|nr:nuclease-related domain-containing protein [Actinomadura madurae]URM98242.1 NERD domain-containing protein [Actinomadura madurae]URN08931.1 NERD domain-containing protein [Actinomadura madurae]
MRSSGVGMSAAGASALHRYRTLAAKHRWERRAVRAAVAGAAGVVAAGLGPWWIGFLVAVLVFTGHAAYTRFRPSPMASWRRGARAERRTGRRLARLDPAGFHVLHDRALHDGPMPVANLDHLVVGLTGIYAIVSRRFRWGARLRAEQRRLWVGHSSVGGVANVATRAADTVAEMLSKELGQDVSVTPLVVVHGARVAREGVRHGSVLFRSARTIPRAIEAEPVIYTSAQVAALAAAAEKRLPPMMEALFPE